MLVPPIGSGVFHPEWWIALDRYAANRSSARWMKSPRKLGERE